jgi:hypothetical protein
MDELLLLVVCDGLMSYWLTWESVALYEDSEQANNSLSLAQNRHNTA